MGRKTWESLPFRPLPGRRNIVLSSQTIEGVEVYSSIENCCEKLKEDFVKKIFIIGGQSIYDSFYPKASTLHLTIIKENVEGIDVFFPVSLEANSTQPFVCSLLGHVFLFLMTTMHVYIHM